MSNQVFAQNGTKYPFAKMRECLTACIALTHTQCTPTAMDSNS